MFMAIANNAIARADALVVRAKMAVKLSAVVIGVLEVKNLLLI
jgi:hypothetical protein